MYQNKPNAIQRARIGKGLTQEALAGRCGYSDDTIRAWESGAGVQATGQAAGECPRPLPHQAPGRREGEWQGVPRVGGQAQKSSTTPGCRGWLV